MSSSILVYIPTLRKEENLDNFYTCESLFTPNESRKKGDSHQHHPEVRIIVAHHDSIDEHSKEGNDDWIFLKSALKCCHEDEYLILCKDTSVSNASSSTIMKTIYEIIDNFDNNPWDITYLCKWLDRCDMYSDRYDLSDSNSKLVRTYSPYGTQCLLISPRGQDKLLDLYPFLKSKKNGFLSVMESDDKTSESSNKFDVSNSSIERIDATLGIALNQAINTGKLVAMTISPNLINFDPSKASKSADYRKTIECRDPPKIYCPDKYTKNNTAFFWFIVIVFVVFLLICILSYSINYGLPSVEEYNLKKKPDTVYFEKPIPETLISSTIPLQSSVSPGIA